MIYCDRDSNLRKTFYIVNSLLFVVFIIYMLNLSIIGSYIDYTKISSVYSWLVLSIIIAAQVYVGAGIYGTLVEIISGESVLFTFKKCMDNARKYWRINFFVVLFPYLIHFIFFVIHPEIDIARGLISELFFIILIYILTVLIIKEKYIRRLNLDDRKVLLSNREVLFILGCYVVNLIIFYLPFINVFFISITRILLLFSVYVHFVMFVYITMLVIRSYPEIINQYDYTNELYLIHPVGGNFFYSIAFSLYSAYPPAFTIIKALTPSNYRIRTFSRVFWRERYYKSDILVAITCVSKNCYEAYKLAKEFKKRGSMVVIGGPHVTFLSDEALEYCDSVVIGEAEGVWKDVLKDYENNCLKNKYYGELLDDYYKYSHKELLNSKPEVIKEYLETTRGCRFKCEFCTVEYLSKGKIRKKPVHEIVELISKIKTKYKTIHFIDNNIYSDPEYAKKLFKDLKPLNIKWQTGSSLDIVSDEEAIKLAKDSGCKSLLIGYEISADSLYSNKGGKLGMAGKYRELTKKLNENGIKVDASFIFGFDADTFLSLLDIWKFCISVFPLRSTVSLLTPLPGSRLYYQMIEQDRLINLNWRRYNMMDLVFRHNRMNNYLLSRTFPLIYFMFLISSSLTGICLASIFFFIIIITYLFRLI